MDGCRRTARLTRSLGRVGAAALAVAVRAVRGRPHHTRSRPDSATRRVRQGAASGPAGPAVSGRAGHTAGRTRRGAFWSAFTGAGGPQGALRAGVPLTRSRRVLTRAGAFVAVCALVMIGPAQPAYADSCTAAPTPEGPGQGVAGFFMPTPKQIPKGEDPFAPGAKTTPFEQYGLGGLSWYVYDPGCGGAIRDPSGSISSWAGRTLFIPAKAGVAALVAVSGAALEPNYLSAFDPLLQNLTDALHKAIFTPIAPLAVMLTGLFLMARSTRQRVSDSTTAVGWALLVMVIAAALFAWPVKAGHAADKAIGGAVGVVSQGLTSSDEPPGRQVANQLYNSFLYRMWLTGEFCDPDSVGARKYGQDILNAQAFSWAESDLVAKKGGAAAAVQAHKQLFDETAAKIKQEDPVAYECVAGHSSAPLEASILADLGIIVMAPFLLLGGLILIAAYIIIRFAVILAPALLTAGAFFPLRGIVQGAARVVTAALLNAVVFTICTLFVIRVDTLVLDPATALPSWLRLVLLGVVTVVMWYLTRPFRKLTTMVSPRSFSEGIGEVNAGLRARAGAMLRRRRENDFRKAMEETLAPREDAPQPHQVTADGKYREEARGPVSMPARRLRVSAERVPRAEALGIGSGMGAGLPPPAGLSAGPRGALPGPLNGGGAVLDGDASVLPVVVRPDEGHTRFPFSRRPLVTNVPDGVDPQYDEPLVGQSVAAPESTPRDRGGYDDDHRGGSTAGYGGYGGSAGYGDEPADRRDRSGRAAPTRQAEFAGPTRVPTSSAAEGLFDPSAPYLPNPEDAPPPNPRHVQAQVIDGEEVYQLYDPGTDQRNDPWSR